jgi:hypothetical protein
MGLPRAAAATEVQLHGMGGEHEVAQPRDRHARLARRAGELRPVDRPPHQPSGHALDRDRTGQLGDRAAVPERPELAEARERKLALPRARLRRDDVRREQLRLADGVLRGWWARLATGHRYQPTIPDRPHAIRLSHCCCRVAYESSPGRGQPELLDDRVRRGGHGRDQRAGGDARAAGEHRALRARRDQPLAQYQLDALLRQRRRRVARQMRGQLAHGVRQRLERQRVRTAPCA